MSDRPHLLLIAFSVIPVVLILWRCYSSGRRDLQNLSGNWLKVDFANVYLVKFFFSSLFFVLFIMLATMAAAGFRWGNRPVPDERSGAEIVFVIDLSNSMLAEDIVPSRIKRSAVLAKEIAQASPGARIAVVGFKGQATLLLPATEDVIALDNLLSSLHPQLVTTPGTNIEAGLLEGLHSYSDIFESRRIMVLFTDGEFLSGDPLKLARRFKEENVSLVIVGVGEPGPAKVPLGDGSFLTDIDGNVLTTEFRPDILKKLGAETGGTVLMVAESGVRELLLEHISGRAGNTRWGYEFESIDRFRFFLGLALLSLAASLAVRSVRWRGMF
ncbi:MAG: VWA domain-containing protein [Spirochaetales bacterium]|nr:VWA domain-containing protein [Spirochaetales bacterium]